MRWQMALYKEMAGKAEDADAPEKVVKRVQEVSAVLYHLEVVRDPWDIEMNRTQVFSTSLSDYTKSFCFYRQSIPLNPRRWCGTNCCPSRGGELWSLALGWRRCTTYRGETAFQEWHPTVCSQTNLTGAWKSLFCNGRHRASNMFLEGYKRNWLHTEGYAFEDRMIDDLSVGVILGLFNNSLIHSFIYQCLTALLSHCSSLSAQHACAESNGAGRRRWRGGEGNKAWSAASAHSAFQSYGSDRKEVGGVHTDETHKCHTWFLVHHLSPVIQTTVNLTRITFIWHMPTLWQRWVIAEGFGPQAVCIMLVKILIFSLLPFIFCSELPYWWGRRRGWAKCWGWDVLWGATVRTGNGRPGAGDQEHRGAVALKALSDLIIATLLHTHPSLSLSVSCLMASVRALSVVVKCCALFVVSCSI